MARLTALVRLMVLLSKRDTRSLRSVGLNNFFFCILFLMAGGTAKQAFASTLLFQVVLLIPLLFAISADALERIPAVREGLLPLDARERYGAHGLSVALSPAFWLLGTGLAMWAGWIVAVCYLGLAVLVQAIVFAGVSLVRRHPRLRLARSIPQIPGAMGGPVQVAMRHMVRALDVYAALLLSLCGTAYRFLDKSANPDAFPILALLVALALSTYAQCTFGLETRGSMDRYRLMPLAGWRLLLAKDLVYLAVAAVLVLPLGFKPGMSFSLVALAVGRYPSIRQAAKQRAWRFMGGDVRFGALQIVLGMLAGLGSFRVSAWLLAGSAGVYLVSLPVGHWWWRRQLLSSSPRTVRDGRSGQHRGLGRG